jgi:hypothetical protein
MISCVGLIPIYGIWLSEAFPILKEFSPVFWLETLALWAFGLSWTVKGEMVLADE